MDYLNGYRSAVRIGADAVLATRPIESRNTLDELRVMYVQQAWSGALAQAERLMTRPLAIRARHRPRARFVARNGTGLHITPPFRPVDLRSYPPGTWAVPIGDGTHCAILALSDLLTATQTDAAALLSHCSDAEQGRILLHTHARFLYELAQAGLDGLPQQHLRGWQPRAILDAPTDIATAPAMIAGMATTEAGIASLALQWVAVAYVRALAGTSASASASDAVSMRDLQDALQRLDALRGAVFERLLRCNAEAAARQGVAPGTHATQAIFRSCQHHEPVLALVPFRATAAPRAMKRRHL